MNDLTQITTGEKLLPYQSRRTFAIISHPDAGKTTLTEKLLLYGGAVQLAGSVTARRKGRATTSDWMELEKQRGISVSSTVLQFDYAGYRVNLLDTPGHADFSEDTYRVLTAVDAAIMVIDAGKGIEAQTRKLFEVCRRRGVPIFTFMNKLDRPARAPLDLLDELENVLGLHACPMNYPLGDGAEFRGVYDRFARQVHLFERTVGGAYRAPVEVADLSDALVREKLAPDVYEKTREEIEMLEIAGAAFDPEKVLAGELSPVFFGSAANNFGVQLLLDGFLKYSAPPAPRGNAADNGELIEPAAGPFAGFIFKIQANMDPRHRDRIAFLRVCSGRFARDMTAFHSRTGKRVRLSHPAKLFAQERETVDEAFPGDIVGLVGHDSFGIGDTLSDTPAGGIVFDEIPRFAPETFASLRNANTGKYKQFRQGLDQLLQEGVIQVFHLREQVMKVPLLGAVGPLQFEVVQYRLQSEYSAESRLEPATWSIARWLETDADLAGVALPTGVALADDTDNAPVLLFPTDWSLRYFQERHPALALHATPPRRALALP
ncbi:MAG: peptide chain release factor 3 [Verrucomicrobia bacterium]|nr:peptide chain release factor 3 [Verrucomicrobiota bacterium]